MATPFNLFLDPATQQQISRNQLLAQSLQQQALTPEQGQMVSGHYVAPSFTQGLAKLLQGYVGRQLNDKADEQARQQWETQRDLMFKALGGNPMGSDGTSTTNSASALSQGAQAGDVGSTVGNAARMDAMPQMPASGNGFINQGSGNFNLANLLRSSAISSIGGDPAASAFWKQYEPTDATRMAMAAGTDPSIANKQMLAKQTYIAPTRLGEGAYADPSGNIQGLPAAAPSGYINQRNPQTGAWETVPVNGGLDAVGQSTGVKTAAENDNKIVMVKYESGKEIPMYGKNAVNYKAPVQSNSPASANFDLSTPQKIQQANQDIAKLRLTNPQEADKVQQALDEQKFANVPKMQTPQGIGQSTYQEQTQKSQGEAAAKLQENLGTQANAANQKISLNNQALSLLDKSDLGPGASVSADLKSIIQKYVPGISESSFANTPSATLSLQKELLNAATAKAKAQFGARITQQEVQLMLSKGSPNVNMPKAAIQYLIQSDNAAANYDIQKANDFGKYLQSGGDPYQFEGWYAKNFPLTNETGQVHLNTSQPSKPQTQSATITKTLNGKTYTKINGQWHEGE